MRLSCQRDVTRRQLITLQSFFDEASAVASPVASPVMAKIGTSIRSEFRQHTRVVRSAHLMDSVAADTRSVSMSPTPGGGGELSRQQAVQPLLPCSPIQVSGSPSGARRACKRSSAGKSLGKSSVAIRQSVAVSS